MAKNILIFSDGTGQAGGLIPDEVETNVYKLYRATRCGPVSSIDPSEQVAFYDPGLGSAADGGGLALSLNRRIYNFLSQATGFGLTQNIIDCYAAIIRLYQPGDRIFLFGFSRGAYTARCVGGVLAKCGVPTQGADGGPLLLDQSSAKRLATKAVKGVYLFGNGCKAERFARQREELAQRFRKTYSAGDEAQSNTVPYFIGVWDTVAAIGASWDKIVIATFLAIVMFLFFVFVMVTYFPSHWPMAQALVTMLAATGFFILLIKNVRYATGLSDPWYKTLYFALWKVRFYDFNLNPRVAFAKHALSIDENRKDFGRVQWNIDMLRDNTSAWFEQIWFAGIHANIGGGYSENESRLSDITLQWMMQKAASVPFPIRIDAQYLKLFPASSGMQHDERRSGVIPWTFGLRQIDPMAPLHPSVLERFKLPSVLVYDRMAEYRPEALRNHEDLQAYYPKT